MVGIRDLKAQLSASGGLVSAAFIENIRETGSCQHGVEPASFALLWRAP